MNARRSRPRPDEPEALGPRGAGIMPPALLCGDNLGIMTRVPEGCCQLIYADPPFFTGKTHACAPRDGAGGQGRPERGATVSDRWPQGINSYLEFLRPRLDRMRHLLGPAGTLYVHLDWHAVHYVKVLLDELFGMDHFLGEIIWSYRTGGRSRNWLARKHDTILCYARKSGLQTFNLLREGTFRTDGMKYDEEGRPYKQTKGGRLYFHPDGPAMTDVWEIPFLSTVSLERTGYPTQKPEALLERIIQLSSSPGDVVGDFFCGSGTTLAAAQRLGRRWLGCDLSAEAVRLAARRLGTASSDGMPPGKSKDRGTRARGRTSGVECP